MSRPCLRQYLRTHRLKAGLTQSELATLIGISEDVISGIERDFHGPTLRVAFGLARVFGVPVNDLFPGVFGEVEAGLAERASAVLNGIRGTDAWSTRKAEFLAALTTAEPTASPV
jgi:putative transcriptional regulator